MQVAFAVPWMHSEGIRRPTHALEQLRRRLPARVDFGPTDFGPTDFGSTGFGSTGFGSTGFGSVGLAESVLEIWAGLGLHRLGTTLADHHVFALIGVPAMSHADEAHRSDLSVVRFEQLRQAGRHLLASFGVVDLIRYRCRLV